MTLNLLLRPATGTFDTQAIRAHLESLPDVFIDPLGTGRYLMTGHPNMVETYREDRIEDPSCFPYVDIIDVTPEYVSIFLEHGDDDKLRSARELLRWMIARFEPIIEDEYGKDWTDRIRREGVDVLYPSGL